MKILGFLMFSFVLMLTVPVSAEEPACPEKIGDFTNHYREIKHKQDDTFCLTCGYKKEGSHSSAKLTAYWSPGSGSKQPCSSSYEDRWGIDGGRVGSKSKRAIVHVISAHFNEERSSQFKQAALQFLETIEKLAAPCSALPEGPVAEQPPTPAEKPNLEVTIQLDTDEQLTPADQARLNFKIENMSRKGNFRSMLAEIELEGELSDQGVIQFLNVGKKNGFRIPFNPYMTGDIWDFSAEIRVAGETNRWVFEKLIKVKKDDEKPFPEQGFPLANVIRVKVWETSDRKVLLFDRAVSIQKGDEVHRLSYPDLSELAGLPPGGEKEKDYYKRGDLGWTYCSNALVRAVALRAARYGGSSKAALESIPSGNTDLQLISPGERDPASRELARRIWLGQIGPGKESKKETFICQSHSLLLGSLLRALGIPTRAVNTVCFLLPVDITVYGRGQSAQDAASEVFYDNKWHFYGLYNKSHPFTDHFKHYTRFGVNYEQYVGVQRWEESSLKNRFQMQWKELRESPVWRLAGTGSKWVENGFLPLPAPPPLSQVSVPPHLIYTVHSPVAAMLMLADGRKTGASGSISPGTFRGLLLGEEKERHGIVNEIPGAYYYPEGLTLYRLASDPGSMMTMKQTIVLPVKDAGERQNHRILLAAIGDGPYEIRSAFWDQEGSSYQYAGIKGNVSIGEQLEVLGSTLKPMHDETDPESEVASESFPHEEEPSTVKVDIDWFTDTLVTQVIVSNAGGRSQADLEQSARQAAMPRMLDFLRTLQLRDGVAFGEVMEGIPGVMDQIVKLLTRSQAIAVKPIEDGSLMIELRLQLKELRQVLPSKHFP
jgi:hypothetical protein